jgi:hypothetical protein
MGTVWNTDALLHFVSILVEEIMLHPINPLTTTNVQL